MQFVLMRLTILQLYDFHGFIFYRKTEQRIKIELACQIYVGISTKYG